MRTIEEHKRYLRSAITSANNTFLAISDVILHINEDLSIFSNDDKKDIALLLNAVKSWHYSIATMTQVEKMLGVDRAKERYFNIVDGEPVEVKREHFVGPLTDEEDALA